MRKPSKSKGFTFFELMLIIVLVSILVAVAVPRYKQLSNDNTETKTRNSLSALRSQITIYYANQVVDSGKAKWPDTKIFSQLPIEKFPLNPYQAEDMAPDSIVIGFTKGITIGGRGGWVYNPETGEIWANTHISGENYW